jgi:hypothetical protein
MCSTINGLPIMRIAIAPLWVTLAAAAPIAGCALLSAGWINFLTLREVADVATTDHWGRVIVLGGLLCCAPSVLLGIGAARGREPKPSGALARVRARQVRG